MVGVTMTPCTYLGCPTKAHQAENQLQYNTGQNWAGTAVSAAC